MPASVCINYIYRARPRNVVDVTLRHRYGMKEGQKSISLDGVNVALAAQNQYSVKAVNNNNLTYYLFCENKLTTATAKSVIAVYSFRMQDGEGNAALDLIPVINTAGVPGMWDTVSQQFFDNAGTGQFRVGLASKEAVRNLYLEPDVPVGTTIDLSVPAGTTNEDTDILKENNPNYTFNIQYRS